MESAKRIFPSAKRIFAVAAATLAVACVSADASAQRAGTDHRATDHRNDNGVVGYRAASGARVGGGIAASQSWYGYDGYGYDYGPSNYPGYSAGYVYGQASPPVPGYSGYGYGLAPEGYLESCTYAGGPKTYNWTCR